MTLFIKSLVTTHKQIKANESALAFAAARTVLAQWSLGAPHNSSWKAGMPEGDIPWQAFLQRVNSSLVALDKPAQKPAAPGDPACKHASRCKFLTQMRKHACKTCNQVASRHGCGEHYHPKNRSKRGFVVGACIKKTTKEKKEGRR